MCSVGGDAIETVESNRAVARTAGLKAWGDVAPALAAVGIAGLTIASVAEAVALWRDASGEGLSHWNAISEVALLYGSIWVVGVVVALMVIAAATAQRPPRRVYLLGSLYAAAAAIANIAGIVAKWANHPHISRPASWEDVIAFGASAFFALAVCAAGVWVAKATAVSSDA
jgi:hypothetical protein